MEILKNYGGTGSRRGGTGRITQKKDRCRVFNFISNLKIS